MAPPRALAGLLLLALHPSVAAGGQVSATFANSGAGPLTIRWRRHDNSLAPGTEVAPGDAERIKTYGGHVWAVVGPGQSEALRQIEIKDSNGPTQRIDISTGGVTGSPQTPTQQAAAQGGGNDILTLWRSVLQKNQLAADDAARVVRDCGVRRRPGDARTESLSKALAVDAGEPIETRCPDGTTDGLAAHLAGQGCEGAADWLSENHPLRGYHVVCAQRRPLSPERRERAAAAQKQGAGMLASAAQALSGVLGVDTAGAGAKEGGDGGADEACEESDRVLDGLSVVAVPSGATVRHPLRNPQAEILRKVCVL